MRSSLKTERGSAIVEFIFLATILLIPTVYLLITVGLIQISSYAATAIAEHTATLAATGSSQQQGLDRAHRHAQLIADDYGIDEHRLKLNVDCSPAACTDPGARITAQAQITVGIPLIPSFLGVETSLITIETEAHHYVGQFQ